MDQLRTYISLVLDCKFVGPDVHSVPLKVEMMIGKKWMLLDMLNLSFAMGLFGTASVGHAVQ